MTGIISFTPKKYCLEKVLAQGKERACQTNGPVLVSLSQPLLNNMNALSVFSACKSASFRALWGRPEKDFWLVGFGNAAQLIADGETSMDKVGDKYRSLLKQAMVEAPGISGVGPLAIGGFRFDSRAPRDANWRGFPDAMLVLPRFLFTWSGGDVWLTINAMVGTDADTLSQSESIRTELKALENSLSSGDCGESHNEPCQPPVKRVSQSSSEEYARYVKKALKEIQDGLLTKVVLARRKALYAEVKFSLDNALGHLCRHYPDCVVFAIENGGSAFFGATPESLARVNQGTLSLTCLAGSAPRGNNPEEDIRFEQQLLESRKERQEHTAVVTSVTASLKELCQGLQWDSELQILKLENVQHLLTSVTGRLQFGVSILNIVRRLHPTPAVAGLPTERAINFIRRNEGARGWYAAPVGWTDDTGGGEFVVAIRSALLTGKRAILYAGAGIVKGSDPEQEFQETELKFQPLMSALGGSRK